MGLLKIKVKKPWIAYPGSTVQQNYAEALDHGYLQWNITDKTNFSVDFQSLVNPKPFVTLPWLGNVTNTIKHLDKSIVGARYRIFSLNNITQKDVLDISTNLKEVYHASEVTFKIDNHVSELQQSQIFLGVREDLRNPDVLLKLLHQYHSGVDESDPAWLSVYEKIQEYIAASNIEDSTRNIKWILRYLKFDNTLGYGENNEINFENLNGIVGIFGPNRSGKSSIVGTIMYALFNATDRGAMKNLHVINTRKSHCYTKCVINVNGVDYIIERQTVKNENKRGQVNSSTSLNLFKMQDDLTAVDLCGLERKDTEKVIRNLIGNIDDFLLTSFSAQDEIKLFITHGSTKRRQILARFLELDILEQMYDLSKNSINTIKGMLKLLPDREWNKLALEHQTQIKVCDEQLEILEQKIQSNRDDLENLKLVLSKHNNFKPITVSQIDNQRKVVINLMSQVRTLQQTIDDLRSKNVTLELRINKIIDVRNANNLNDLKLQSTSIRALHNSINAIKHSYEKEEIVLRQFEKSLKILDDVPCGDSFPTCKFIKDAHVSKLKIEPQKQKCLHVGEQLVIAEQSLSAIQNHEMIDEQIHKLEQLNELYHKLQIQASSFKSDLTKYTSNLTTLQSNLDVAKQTLSDLEIALKNEENAEVVSLRSKIENILDVIKRLDNNRLSIASERGRILSVIDKNIQEQLKREEVAKTLQSIEMIFSAFSKKGIPNLITKSLLPLINVEISKILQGIVDFTIELEADDESDSMEIYINYGDGRRIIELGSGMEKMIASIAIRVSLINISTLPKTDIFIIDEGFGALDEAGVEACNRLLISLKHYFKTIIVITHVEGVKDIADTIIEITKNEKDAMVQYK